MCNTPQHHPSSSRAPLTHLAAWRQLAAAALCCGLTLSAHALPQDSEQPVEISADQTEFDNSKQQHTLSGNVLIVQGSMRISADQITLLLKNGEITEVKGRGNPLYYSITDSDGKPLKASARQIVYRPIEAKLSLLGNASLNRPDRELSGERIDYNINSARINAQGSAKKRVKIIIQPEKKKK